MSGEEARFHLAISSRFENIDLVHVVLEETLRGLGLDEEQRHWIDLAVREAVANAIKHGNREDPGKEVTVDGVIEGGELVIRVQDQGDGFDFTRVEDPLAPENLLKPNGRGVFYMQRFMDRIDYRFEPGEGTQVTLRKRLELLNRDHTTKEERES